MKILYCSYSQIPSDYANSIAVMKQCSALSRISKLRVILIKGSNTEKKDVFSTYGVAPFSLVLLPKWMLFFREIGLKIFVLLYAIFFRPDIVYSRDILINEWLCLFRIKSIYEIHQLDQEKEDFDILYKRLLIHAACRKELQSIVCMSKSLAEECKLYGIPKNKLTVLHSGVDLRECDEATEAELPDYSQSNPIAVYVGSLQRGKGIELIQRMAEMTSEFNFLIVGGVCGQIEERENLKHIPQVIHGEALGYMKRADYLLLPLTTQRYKFHSPLKLFEYLAMGKVIIASDNDDIREIIVSMENGVLADPTYPEEFIKKMQNMKNHPHEKKRIEENAKYTATQFTWETRAKRIVDLVRSSNGKE